jgi:hypothetical protein
MDWNRSSSAKKQNPVCFSHSLSRKHDSLLVQEMVQVGECSASHLTHLGLIDIR